MYVPLMKMRDLLAMPDFALRLLHGDEASLDGPLRLTYSSDLIDPGRYRRGGELVVSGLVWRTNPQDSETFAANLKAAGAAGLPAGEAMFGEVPSDIVEAFQRHNLLLFSVPGEVSFTQINEAVIGASSAARGDSVGSHAGAVSHDSGRYRRGQGSRGPDHVRLDRQQCRMPCAHPDRSTTVPRTTLDVRSRPRPSQHSLLDLAPPSRDRRSARSERH